MVFFFAVLAATIYLFVRIPKGFIPDQDTDQLAVTTEAAQGTSYYDMVQYQKQIADVVSRDPNVDSLVSSIGGTASSTLGGPNFGQLVVHLKPRNQRAVLVNGVIDELRPKLERFPGMKVYLQNPPTIRIGGLVTKSFYQYTLRSPDQSILQDSVKKLEHAIAEIPGTLDVTSNLAVDNPQVNVIINRDKAAAMQVSADQIENALYDAYGPRWVSTIYAATNEYKVLLELEPKYRQDPGALSLLYFKSPQSGMLIPMDTVAKVVRESGPQTINHFGQLPAVTISFDLLPGASLGNVVDRIRNLSSQMLPTTVKTTFQGAAQAFQTSLGNLWLLLMVAIMVVYIVPGTLYESCIHPLTILSGLPSAGLGALITLNLFHLDLNIYGFVGLIMLIGIVEKNAIMQIDFALEAERKKGLPPRKAIYQGCLIRFRPIMMTTMSALLGAVPIAVGYGAGGEARQPLGLVVVGGLLFSQLVTLYLTPVVCTYMASAQEHFSRRRAAAKLASVSSQA
jgi:HAE1 family hydrophobic/amphiphilic exporter-1